MAVDAKLLILDEPTLGLDIYLSQEILRLADRADYFDRSRTIVVTTHQIDEIDVDILTDFVFLDRGRIVLESERGGRSSRATWK